MRVSVDNERCTGHARCWATAPEVFTIDDDGHSDIGVGREVPARMEDKARLGVASCPERALRIENATAT
ncbi:MAG: ferredoxin [Acidimicrobiales bacterium]